MMLEVVLLSLVFGSVIAILAQSFNFSYRLDKYINFSHVATFLVGTYFGWLFVSSLEIGLFFGLVLVILTSAVFGVIFYFPTFFLKNNYNKILFSIAVLAFIQGLLSLVFKKTNSMPKPTEGLMVGSTLINSTNLMSVFVLLIVLGLAYIILKKTKFGKALRAVLDDERTARNIGINLNLIRLMAFVIASMLAGIAGLLFSLNIGNTSMTLLPGFKAMAVAIIGNFGIGLTVLISFGVLLLENFAQIYLPFSEYYAPFIVFVILLIMLMLRFPKRGKI